MKLLETAGSHLGEIDLWPSLILQYLFNDYPSPVRNDRLKKVIVFFYGNDVPKDLAFQLQWKSVSIRARTISRVVPCLAYTQV